MRKNRPANGINLNNFDVIDFFEKHEKINRIYLFDVLNSFNFFGYSRNNVNNQLITFDGLTKLGNLIPRVKIIEHKEKLNSFFIEIMTNNKIGFAFPIFKYCDNMYDKHNSIIHSINLNNVDDLNQFEIMLSQCNDILIIFKIEIKGDLLFITYGRLDDLKIGK